MVWLHILYRNMLLVWVEGRRDSSGPKLSWLSEGLHQYFAVTYSSSWTALKHWHSIVGNKTPILTTTALLITSCWTLCFTITIPGDWETLRLILFSQQGSHICSTYVSTITALLMIQLYEGDCPKKIMNITICTAYVPDYEPHRKRCNISRTHVWFWLCGYLGGLRKKDPFTCRVKSKEAANWVLQ